MNKTVIDFFDGTDYDFLSNFHPSPVIWQGMLYPTVEHAFQASKSLNPMIRESIQNARSPGQAKQMGRACDLRSDWEGVKYGIMSCLVWLKFQDSDLRRQLLQTTPATLIEGNTWGDIVWGVYEGKGENHLGRILMAVREGLGASLSNPSEPFEWLD